MFQAFCMTTLIFISSLTLAISQQCPSEYYPQFGACYSYKYIKNGSTLLSADNAEKQCKQDHGYLVSIGSKFETDFVISLTTFPGITVGNPFWIGLTYSNGNYRWSDNTPFTPFSYTNWNQSFPNLSYGNCVVLVPGDKYPYEGRWMNANCADVKGFMCKNFGTASTTVRPTIGPNTCPTPNYSDYGTIQAPGYPIQYGNNLNCQYHLSVAQGHTVTITFNSDFSTEACCDIVTVYDGNDTHSTVIARLSGKNGANRSFTSTRNVMLVNFFTDPSTTDIGWGANFNPTGQTGACPSGATAGWCLADFCPPGFSCVNETRQCCPTAGGSTTPSSGK